MSQLADELQRIRPHRHLLATLGTLMILFGQVGPFGGLLQTFAAIGAEGLTPSEKDAMLWNGIQEAILVELTFGLWLGVAGVGMLVAARMSGRLPETGNHGNEEHLDSLPEQDEEPLDSGPADPEAEDRHRRRRRRRFSDGG